MNPASAWLVEPLLAELEARVGVFLGAKARLYRVRGRAETSEVRDAVQDLLGVQTELESQLPEVLAVVGRINAGRVTGDDLVLLAVFGGQVGVQLQRVTTLEARVGPAGAVLPAALTGVALIGFAFVARALRRAGRSARRMAARPQ